MVETRRAVGRMIRVAAMSVLLAGGCAPDPAADSTVLVVESRARPVLTSGRDQQITLFGGLGPRGESSYSGRMRGTMLQHSFSREGADFDCHMAKDGERFVFSSTRHSDRPNIYIKTLNGTAVTQLTSDPSGDVQPAFSPDGKRVAFASDRTGNWDIWVIGLDGHQPIQVTHTPMDELHPSWSSDGDTLVYCALPPGAGQWELWTEPAQERATPTFIEYGLFPEWSPKDNRILFQRARERGSRWFSVWTIELKDGEPTHPTEIASSADHAMILPSWSHDASHIAYTTVSSLPAIDPDFGDIYESSDIWVIDAQGGSRVRLTDGHTVNFGPVWTPEGRVLFTSARTGHENIWSAVPRTGVGSQSPVARSGRPVGSPKFINTGASFGE